MRRRRRLVAAIGIPLVLLLGLGAVAGFVWADSVGLVGGSQPGETVEVEIPEGTSAQRVGVILEEAGVIPSALGFRLAVRLRGGATDIEAGRYELRTGLTPYDALDSLAEGPVVEFVTVTFPEGSWLTDFARILDEGSHISGKRFLKLATSGQIRSKFQADDVDTLEGLLFPDTYQIVSEDTAKSVLKRLVDEFDKRASKLEFAIKDELDVSTYDAIIVASMVEAETLAASERGKVARVIYNRIEAGDLLGIDATVLYALGEHKEVLTESDLQIDSPYNTRLHAGLPPTPIGAPGQASLQAAADPPQGDWYFYVLADCRGNHAFSESSAQFARDKARYQELDC